jgi:hypothetical protein
VEERALSVKKEEDEKWEMRRGVTVRTAPLFYMGDTRLRRVFFLFGYHAVTSMILCLVWNGYFNNSMVRNGRLTITAVTTIKKAQRK